MVNVRQQFKATAEKGIGTSCSISHILFAMGMSLMKAAAERTTREVCNVPTSEKMGLMDDLIVTITTYVQARWVISSLKETVTWTRYSSPGVRY